MGAPSFLVPLAVQARLGLASVRVMGSVYQPDTCLHLTRMSLFLNNARVSVGPSFWSQLQYNQTWLGLASVTDEGNVVQPGACFHLTGMLVFLKDTGTGVSLFWCH